MIRFKLGNILTEDVEALVNTVNCVGVMGRGIALQFKKAYPDNFRAYAKACKLQQVRLGHMFVYETDTITNPRHIVNFPTKKHWRDGSRLSYIETGLDDLVRVIKEHDIHSIAIPPLGSGLGGLDWIDVRSLIENRLRDLADLQIVIFEPTEEPEITSMPRSQ